MKKRRLFLFHTVLILSLIVVSPAYAQDSLQTLQPGEQVNFEQTVPINLIFIGYERDRINREALRDQLPRTYEPIARVPRLYYGLGRDLGLRFDFNYNITFKGKNFADRFFGYLQEIGTPGDPTFYQQLYNDQEKNVLDVTGPVLYIDGPSVEAWLVENLELSPQSYTVVFINWYSRPDFQFHVYTKTDEPDPDTGHNFGEDDFSKMIAWGGTSSRLWFYDLSAGPEWNTDNWNVDQPDLDGDGVEEYRMPPIWEYTRKGYRRPGLLGKDLGLVTRYVAINLLFTTSPLYDPLAAAPGVGGNRIVHITMFEDHRRSLGTDWIKTDLILDELAALQPYYNWQVHLTDVNPIDDQARRAFRIFAGVRQRDDCWNDFGTTFAELFCFFNANRDQYVPVYGEADYVLPVFAFNTTQRNMGDFFGLLGYADDNWTDGTQSFVFEFDTPELKEFGYGFTTTTIHEAGHHFALSHPHDGYDSEKGIEYGPGGEFYYVWVGDESDSIMQYLGLTNGFSHFDQDNLYRYEFAGYLNWANDLLDDILAHPNAGDVQDNITQAEAYATQALASFETWDYLAAAANARLAYEQIAMAAAELGISTVEERLLVAPSFTWSHEGDWIRPR